MRLKELEIMIYESTKTAKEKTANWMELHAWK
jgi:hypothetical protein